MDFIYVDFIETSFVVLNQKKRRAVLDVLLQRKVCLLLFEKFIKETEEFLNE
jgi:hypothetical protein